MLGGLLELPAWTGNLGLFAAYWTITVVVFWASRRFARRGVDLLLSKPVQLRDFQEALGRVLGNGAR